MSAEVAPLPPHAILLHIGPYKTGSTAIQRSLFNQRSTLAEHGIYYPDKWRRVFRQGHALMRWAPRGQPLPPECVWDDFAADLRTRDGVRICLSTEDFGRLPSSALAGKVVEDLGADRLHVLAVARAYHRLLPSHWQERVKSAETLSYDAWLHQVLEGDDTQRAHRYFWASHDTERTIRLWSEVLPADRFTVVVSDGSDRLLLSRSFEQLLDLPPGLLAPEEGANASLSMNAAELLRRVNVAFAAHGWADPDYRALVRHGVVLGLQRAGRTSYDDPMPALPGWAQPLVAERSRARVEAIRTLGVRVIGDPDCLVQPEQEPADERDLAPDTVSIEAAAGAVVGALDAYLRKPDRKPHRGRGPKRPAPTLADTSARALLSELRRRARARVTRGR